VGSAEASVVGLALWGMFAFLTLLLYWDLVGRGATPLTSRLDRFLLQMLSRGAAVTEAAGPRPRRSRGYRAGVVLVGAGMTVLTQWVAVSTFSGLRRPQPFARPWPSSLPRVPFGFSC